MRSCSKDRKKVSCDCVKKLHTACTEAQRPFIEVLDTIIELYCPERFYITSSGARNLKRGKKERYIFHLLIPKGDISSWIRYGSVTNLIAKVMQEDSFGNKATLHGEIETALGKLKNNTRQSDMIRERLRSK